MIQNSTIHSALTELDIVNKHIDARQDTDFWIQCVRDTSGRWSRYYHLKAQSKYSVSYFRGRQAAVDYDNPAEVAYIRSNLETRRAFYQGLLLARHMDTDAFRHWLEQLRRTLEYQPIENWLHKKFSTPAHSLIVQAEIRPIAKTYQDPYASGLQQGPNFSGFPPEALPADKEQDGLIYHLYPTLDYSELYFSHALEVLKRLLGDAYTSERAYIYDVAYFFQLLVNLHYFAAINASLYMNMANGMLDLGGIGGVEHGIVDFVALRLQPSTFQKYFYDEVKRGQYSTKAARIAKATF